MSPLMRTLAGLALAATAFGASGSTTVAGRSSPPATDTITIDVTVVDRQQRPVLTLQPSDFAVMVDGVPREVRGVRFIRRGAVEGAGRADRRHVPEVAAGPPPVIIIVIDERSFSRDAQRGVRSAAKQLIDRLFDQFGRDPRIAVIRLPSRVKELRPTTIKAHVQEEADRIAGRAERPSALLSGPETASPLPDDAEEAVDRESSGVARPNVRRAEPRDPNRPLQAEDVRAALAEHGRELIANLTVLIRALEAAAGTKTIVLLATDLVSAPRGPELQRLARAAAASRVSLTVLQAAPPAWLREFRKPADAAAASSAEPAAGVSADADPQGDPLAVGLGGLPTLAAAGGGHVYSLAGAPTAADAVAGELAGFYAVEVDARGTDRDGEPHRVGVRMNAAGLLAAVRPWWIARDDRRDLPPPPPAAAVPAQGELPSNTAAGVAEVRPGERRALTPLPLATSNATPPRLDDLLGLASAYVATFEKQFSSVVAEELQEQLFRPLVSSSAQKVRRQITRADYLLVQDPEGDGWLPFRDVFEVDGALVHDREDRLHTLFLERRPGATAEAKRITDESARFNIGTVTRTMNVPTLPLLFLRAGSRARFAFKVTGSETVGPRLVWKVRFNETARPTFVSDTRGGNIPASGTFWIDPETGAVVRSELQLLTQIRATATVNYAPGVVAGLWVPAEMREHYEGRSGLITTVASYSNFRRFQVLIDEVMKPPSP